jgi:hypothetical protein
MRITFHRDLLSFVSIHSDRRERNISIHPDNRQNVQLFREHVQPNSQTGTDTEVPPVYVGRPRQDTCPICLTDSSVLSVETNCGHLYCGLYYYKCSKRNQSIVANILLLGKCITTFWKFQNDWMIGMSCPVCRQSVRSMIDVDSSFSLDFIYFR